MTASEQVKGTREQQLRIQALGDALSRRDWHATERAYEAIRDNFDAALSSAPARSVLDALHKSAIEAFNATGRNLDQSQPRSAETAGQSEASALQSAINSGHSDDM